MKKVVAEKVEVPLCSRCGENPRWKVTKRATGVEYYWSLCKQCENERQRINRAKRKARRTPVEELGLNNSSVAAQKKHGIETAGDAEKLQGELSDLKIG